MFDYIIVGAGINGCALAYFLTRSAKSVALVDAEGVVSGGSGAAGAFISPKISKSGPLKELHDHAFAFSMDFYQTHFSELIKTSPLLHLAKHDDENAKVAHFKAHSPLHVSNPDESLLNLLQDDAKMYESLYLNESGVVDAKGLCLELSKDIAFYKERVESLTCKKDYCQVNALTCKHVILATGAYEQPFDLPYIDLRGVWGHRIDIATSSTIPLNMHQFVSISKSENAKAAIGATHNVHYHPQKSSDAYDIESGRAELLAKANMTIALENVEILKDYTGLRSGSNDYLPLIGPLVDEKATLEKLPNLSIGEHYSDNAFVYHPNLSIINGTGGYGFVFGPYLAKALSEYLLEKKPFDTRLNPTRFFRRWVKRSLSGKS